ncbi:hypothetical protein [Antarctobacter heliothermus]|uniref:Uncharacterized protein n=1 Tax=Antarctobacter heliothermus TaxID=74033 RepID=A0A239D4G2_9RHOB|nr:hypothetical protein [Antarctobacter heliothermus]SNS27177.1 hypothetical protein SAMN04488078_100972 [Antarctobacter heliothermus]
MSALLNGFWLALFGPLMLLPVLMRQLNMARVTATCAKKGTK